MDNAAVCNVVDNETFIGNDNDNQNQNKQTIINDNNNEGCANSTSTNCSTPTPTPTTPLSHRDHIIYIPRKVSGKANPKRDILLFLLFLLSVFYISYQMGNVGVSTSSSSSSFTYSASIYGWKNRRKQFKRMLLDPLVNVMTNYLQNHGIQNRNDFYNCHFYVGLSSIMIGSGGGGGGSSWGIFAGRKYQKGESILTDYYRRLPTTTTTTTTIQPLSFLLKPHLILSNVRWHTTIISEVEKEEEKMNNITSTTSTVETTKYKMYNSILLATRNITEGEELFLSWEDHPYSYNFNYNNQQDQDKSSSSSSSSSSSFHSSSSSSSMPTNDNDTNNDDGPYDYIFHDTIPTLKHYQRADDLIRDTISVYLSSNNDKNNKNYRPNRGRGPGNKNRNSNNNYNKRKKKQQQDVKSGLLLLQRIVARYEKDDNNINENSNINNPSIVAKLLPKTEYDLTKYYDEYYYYNNQYNMYSNIHNTTININNDNEHNNDDINYKQTKTHRMTPTTPIPMSMSILGSLKNQTVASLAVNAQCMSHIRWESSTSTSSPIPRQEDKNVMEDTTTTTTQTTTGEDTGNHTTCSPPFFSITPSPSYYHQIVSKENGFLRGDIVAIVPLLILQHHPQKQKKQSKTTATKSVYVNDGNDKYKYDGDNKVDPSMSSSFESESVSAIADTCLPLQLQEEKLSSSLSSLSLCPLFGIQEVTQEIRYANVEYKWSISNHDSMEGQKILRSFLLLLSSLSSSSPSSERDDDDEQIKYKETQQQHIAQLKSILLKVSVGKFRWHAFHACEE